jgi:hypothetical protein
MVVSAAAPSPTIEGEPTMTAITFAETLEHLSIVWHDDAETLEKFFQAALGREVTYTRVGELAHTQFGGDTICWVNRLITESGTLTRVQRSADGVCVSLTIGGVRTSVHGRHPVADATRFALTIAGARE